MPTPNVSLIDLVFTPKRDTTVEEMNDALKAASEGAMKGVLGYTDQPLVSSDFNHIPASSTVDSLETAVMEGKLARVVSWYDNEWGFSNRMIDTAGVMARSSKEPRWRAGFHGIARQAAPRAPMEMHRPCLGHRAPRASQGDHRGALAATKAYSPPSGYFDRGGKLARRLCRRSCRGATDRNADATC